MVTTIQFGKKWRVLRNSFRTAEVWFKGRVNIYYHYNSFGEDEPTIRN